MSSDFVRYSPEIETVDPHLDELLPQIIAIWERLAQESPTSEGAGRAVRGAHAKTLGVVEAEVEILRSPRLRLAVITGDRAGRAPRRPTVFGVPEHS